MEDSKVKGLTQKTMEQRIMEKFDELQIAREHKREQGADVAFDELSQSIETLFFYEPKIYDELMKKKKVINDGLLKEKELLQKKVDIADDDIARQLIWTQGYLDMSWEYRELLEELYMRIIIDGGLVPRVKE